MTFLYTRILFSICAALLILFKPKLSFSIDSTLYSVPLKNFSVNVYSETISKYKLVSCGSEFIIPNNSFQKIINKKWIKKNYNIILQCGNTGYKVDSNNEKYLINTRLLNLKNPELKKVIKRIQKTKHKKQTVNNIEKFVNAYIHNKKMGIPLISAAKILKSRTGDCTEHTVLSVALLRSLGIPARALVGMFLSREFEGSSNVFVYHMWAEAFADGHWMIVDATRPGHKPVNRYIAFCYHHLKTEMPLAYLKAVSAMKIFSVKYIKQ